MTAAQHHGPAFARSQAQVGARKHVTESSRGHWLKMLGLLAPLVIGELVHDPQKRWRYIRIASLVAAGLSEVSWQRRVRRDGEQMARASPGWSRG